VTGTRLEDDIAAPRLRGDHGQGCQVRRSRKLLEADLILASDGLGREGLDQVGDRRDVRAHDGPKAGQVKCKPGFQKVVGIALGPCPVRRCAAVQLLHRLEESLFRKTRIADISSHGFDRVFEALFGNVE